MAKILITEDSAVILEMMKEIVSSEGHQVITAIDGVEALHKARCENPDLIILDLMLPKMDGFKVCGLIKMDARYAKIPIIMLTAKAQDSDRELGKEVGAEAYLLKPIDAEILLKKINELLKK